MGGPSEPKPWTSVSNTFWSLTFPLASGARMHPPPPPPRGLTVPCLRRGATTRHRGKSAVDLRTISTTMIPAVGRRSPQQRRRHCRCRRRGMTRPAARTAIPTHPRNPGRSGRGPMAPSPPFWVEVVAVVEPTKRMDPSIRSPLRRTFKVRSRCFRWEGQSASEKPETPNSEGTAFPSIDRLIILRTSETLAP